MTLSEYMAARKLTDAELARRIGCDRAYITKIRLRRKVPSLRIAVALERETGLPAATFAAAEAA